MTCKEFADFVMGYLDGQLDLDTHARFERHLTRCPDCVRYLQQYRDTLRAEATAYDDEPVTDVPEDLVRAIVDARKP